jgi:hypothetical protein
MSDDEDLIGALPRKGSKVGRPTNAEKAAREQARNEELNRALLVSQAKHQGRSLLGDPYVMQNGVNVTWLCQAFRQDIKTVRRKLANLKPIGIGARNVEIYDFSQAASFLAKPPPNQLAEFLRGLRVQDLPVHLQHPYWAAMRMRQSYMRDAGNLWRTEDVLEVLGECFKTIKATMQLWVDNLDAQSELSNDLRVLITRMVDGLQDDMHRALIDMPKQRQTKSSADAPESNPDGPDLDEDIDGDLIG